MERVFPVLFLALVAVPAWGAGVWAPQVRLRGSEIIASAARQHHVQSQTIEIVDTDECEASVRGPTTVRVSESCLFLHGLYRYLFANDEGGPRRQLFVEFTLTRRNTKGHALLVAEPVEIEETPPPTVSSP